MENDEGKGTRGKGLKEEFWIAGTDLLARIKELIAEGNVKRILLKNESDRVLLDIPLNTGLLIGGAALMLAPFLAAIAAIAAMTRKVKIEVVRDPENRD